MNYSAIKKLFLLSSVLFLSSGILLYGQHAQQKNRNVVLLVDDSVTHQTIDHFGASDAWSIQFVG